MSEAAIKEKAFIDEKQRLHLLEVDRRSSKTFVGEARVGEIKHTHNEGKVIFLTKHADAKVKLDAKSNLKLGLPSLKALAAPNSRGSIASHASEIHTLQSLLNEGLGLDGEANIFLIIAKLQNASNKAFQNVISSEMNANIQVNKSLNELGKSQANMEKQIGEQQGDITHQDARSQMLTGALELGAGLLTIVLSAVSIALPESSLTNPKAGEVIGEDGEKGEAFEMNEFKDGKFLPNQSNPLQSLSGKAAAAANIGTSAQRAAEDAAESGAQGVGEAAETADSSAANEARGLNRATGTDATRTQNLNDASAAQNDDDATNDADNQKASQKVAKDENKPTGKHWSKKAPSNKWAIAKKAFKGIFSPHGSGIQMFSTAISASGKIGSVHYQNLKANAQVTVGAFNAANTTFQTQSSVKRNYFERTEGQQNNLQNQQTSNVLTMAGEYIRQICDGVGSLWR